MNAYGVIAVVLGVLGAAHTKATATVGGTQHTILLLWLLGAALIPILTVAAHYLIRAVSRRQLWLVARTEIAR